MTGLQLYLIVAPLGLLLFAAVVTYWWVHRPYPEDSRHKQH